MAGRNVDVKLARVEPIAVGVVEALDGEREEACFGLFAEFELSVSTGSSNDAHKRDGELKRIYSDNTKLKLAFNPGAAVYIFPNVCATISFGLGGIQYTSVTQKDQDGNRIGSRKASNMRFRLNVAAINFGMTFHLWDKKKQ